MEIRSLEGTSIEDIMECLMTAFQGYYVELPSDPDIWRTRWRGARVDFALSFGAFEHTRLVGFIITGIGHFRGSLTACNCATGVIPEYRGRRIVQKLYAAAVPKFKAVGITQCTLEVITDNSIAIRAYTSVGFAIDQELLFYKGPIAITTPPPPMQTVAISSDTLKLVGNKTRYAWDSTDTAITILADKYQLHLVAFDDGATGYFVINPVNGYILQFEVDDPNTDDKWQQLFAGIKCVHPGARINNVYASQDRRLMVLDRFMTKMPLKQYEMCMSI